MKEEPIYVEPSPKTRVKEEKKRPNEAKVEAPTTTWVEAPKVEAPTTTWVETPKVEAPTTTWVEAPTAKKRPNEEKVEAPTAKKRPRCFHKALKIGVPDEEDEMRKHVTWDRYMTT